MVMNIKTDGYSIEIMMETDGYSVSEAQTIANDLKFLFKKLHIYFGEYKKSRERYVDAWKDENASCKQLDNLEQVSLVYASMVCQVLVEIENILSKER